LKRRVSAELKKRRISMREASREIGSHESKLGDWLRTSGQRLVEDHAAAVASWLGISPEEAVKLQGGTGEAHRREGRARQAREDAERRSTEPNTHHARQFRVRQRKASRTGATKVHGSKLSSSHKAKIGAGQKAYWARPDARPSPFPGSITLRRRARLTLSALRRFHPNWTSEELETEAVRRMLSWPENLGSEEVARGLIAPRRLLRDRTASLGRPVLTARCEALEKMRLEDEWAWSGQGRAPYGFMKALGRRLGLTYKAMSDWWTDHKADHGFHCLEAESIRKSGKVPSRGTRSREEA
jgi:hypothetical protein